MKYGRNQILECLWDHAEQILYITIEVAVIIVGINVYMLFTVKQSVLCESETIAVEREESQETLYMEETRLSGTEIYLKEVNKDELSGGYLVTAEMAMLA